MFDHLLLHWLSESLEFAEYNLLVRRIFELGCQVGQRLCIPRFAGGELVLELWRKVQEPEILPDGLRAQASFPANSPLLADFIEKGLQCQGFVAWVHIGALKILDKGDRGRVNRLHMTSN